MKNERLPEEVNLGVVPACACSLSNEFGDVKELESEKVERDGGLSAWPRGLRTCTGITSAFRSSVLAMSNEL